MVNLSVENKESEHNVWIVGEHLIYSCRVGYHLIELNYSPTDANFL